MNNNPNTVYLGPDLKREKRRDINDQNPGRVGKRMQEKEEDVSYGFAHGGRRNPLKPAATIAN